MAIYSRCRKALITQWRVSPRGFLAERAHAKRAHATGSSSHVLSRAAQAVRSDTESRRVRVPAAICAIVKCCRKLESHRVPAEQGKVKRRASGLSKSSVVIK